MFIKSLLLSIFIAFFSFSTPAEASYKKLRVMTYNMHGIPCIDEAKYPKIFEKFGISRCPDDTYWSQTVHERFAKLGKILHSLNKKGTLPDILLLQEAFKSNIPIMDNKALDNLLATSPYKYHVRGPKPLVKSLAGAALAYLFHSTGIVDSGLVILSKHPITALGRKGFGKGVPICRDTDCLAHKGVLYAQVKVKGLPYTVDVFNTHYQAGQRYEHIKLKQNPIATNFVQRIRNMRLSPVQIFGGDFNFRNRPDFPSFADFMKRSKMHHAGFLCLKGTKCKWSAGTKKAWINGSELDHQFVSRTDANVQVYPRYMEYGNYSYNNKPLTDHRYLIVDYILSK